MWNRWTPLKVVVAALVLWLVCALLASAGQPKLEGRVVQEVRVWRKGKPVAFKTYTGATGVPDSVEVVMFRVHDKAVRWYYPK